MFPDTAVVARESANGFGAVGKYGSIAVVERFIPHDEGRLHTADHCPLPPRLLSQRNLAVHRLVQRRSATHLVGRSDARRSLLREAGRLLRTAVRAEETLAERFALCSTAGGDSR